MKKYAIIEDEEYAALNLKIAVERVRPDYQLVFRSESVEEAVKFFQSGEEVDLVFMDIELVDGNSFQIFEEVEVRTPVVFTTAYDQYAIEAFKVNSIDYILKPVVTDAINRAITKFETLTEKTPDYGAFARTVSTSARRRILTTSGDTYSYMDLDEVAYFTRDEKYIMAVSLSGKNRMTDFRNLGEIYEITDHSDFFQLSRNILASIRSISKVSQWFGGRLRVELAAGDKEESVVVSSARRQAFLDWFGGKA